MLWPVLITAGIVGGIAAFAPRVTAPSPAPSPPSPPSPPPAGSPGMPPPFDERPPAGRTIRVDPDFLGGTLRARVGDTISMHGVSPRSPDDPLGYSLDTDPGQPVVYVRDGINDYRLTAPGRFTISWAPNHRIDVEVSA